MFEKLRAQPPGTASVEEFRIRRLTAADISAVLAIQRMSPDAAQWTAQQHAGAVSDGMAAGGWIVEIHGSAAGFLTYTSAIPGEAEITNLAVEPQYRRRGVAMALLRRLRHELEGDIFLEVRATNKAAQALYRNGGFVAVGVRRGYYSNPPDDALVMKSSRAMDGLATPADELD